MRPLYIDRLKYKTRMTEGLAPISLRTIDRLDTIEKKAPKMAIGPQQTLVLPQGCVVGRLGDDSWNILRTEEWQAPIDHPILQISEHITNAESGDFCFVGNLNMVESVLLKDNSEIPIHRFDFSNFYTLDQRWMCGSCPHLFGRSRQTKLWEYIGEIFAEEHVRQRFEINNISRWTELVIAEIEDEVSYFELIQRVDEKGDQVYCKENLVLRRGDQIRFRIDNNDTIIIVGSYTANTESYNTAENRLFRNKLVHQKCEELNSNSATQKRSYVAY